MRQIKFRGKVMWHGQHYFSGDWVEGYYFKDEHGKPYIRVNEYVNKVFCRTIDIEIKPGTSGQFTGLKDENGVEIYEGDMILFEDEDYLEAGRTINTSWIATIKFDQYAWKCIDELCSEDMFIEDMQNNGIVDGSIIDNIHPDK